MNRRGRNVSVDEKKLLRFEIRISKQDLELLESISDKLKITKAEAIRLGIKTLNEKLEMQKESNS